MASGSPSSRRHTSTTAARFSSVSRKLPGAAGESAPEIGGNPDRQPGLAYSARADQADQSRGGQRPPGLGQFIAAANETRCLGRQVARSPGGLGHASKVLWPPATELIRLRPDSVLTQCWYGWPCLARCLP